MSDFWEAVDRVLIEIADKQQEELLRCGRRIIPNLTTEDILQPNDYVLLENHPHFRYEEGVFAGVQTVQMALLALKRDLNVNHSISS